MTSLLTVADVAEQLQLSRSQVYTMKAEIGYAKLGGAVRFRQEDIIRFVASSMVGQRRKPHKVQLQCIRL